MPDYWILGHGRDVDYKGEGVYTEIKKSEFLLSAFDIFWLSPQKYVTGSRFEEQSGCPRVCLVTLIRHKESGEIFRIYNAHLDHVSERARVFGMKSVLERISEDKNKIKAHTVLLGDFNESPDGEAIAICNSFEDVPMVDVTKDVSATFHAFGMRKPFVKIDYIFVSKDIEDRVKKIQAWEDQKNGIYLSDHFPVCVEISI